MSEKLRGLGGHMTAALLHKAAWYDHCIKSAWQNGQEATAQTLQIRRASYMLRLREQLKDRGYYGPVPAQEQKAPPPLAAIAAESRQRRTGNNNKRRTSRKSKAAPTPAVAAA
jgi:hypothetical protein